MSSVALLQASGIRFVAGGNQILEGVDVDLAAGERVAVVGPSGSGKSTLLAILAGLIRPTEGQVRLDGELMTGLPGPDQGIALILQGYGLVSLLTAEENVTVALLAAGRSPATAAERAGSVLGEVGLSAHAGHLVEELSGGQQQRTAVARALALDPRLLIADEPTAEQDPAMRALVMARMLAVADRGGALILATHDPEVAEQCDRTLDLTPIAARSSGAGSAIR